MARLGKRERHAKRALIQANLANPGPAPMSVLTYQGNGKVGVTRQRGVEVTPRGMQSHLQPERFLGKVYSSFRNPQNYRGMKGDGVKRYARWSDD